MPIKYWISRDNICTNIFVCWRTGGGLALTPNTPPSKLCIEGLVHPIILVLFVHCHVVSNLYDFLPLWNTKGKNLEDMYWIVRNAITMGTEAMWQFFSETQEHFQHNVISVQGHSVFVFRVCMYIWAWVDGSPHS